MQNKNYISTYTIGQVIKQNDKYWQITKFTNPSTGDWFIANTDLIMCCPSYLNFSISFPRYIVQEVSITPVAAKVNVIDGKNNEKLPIGKIITFNNGFYEVTDYRVPNRDEYYVYINTPPTILRRFGNVSCSKSHNIVTKIQPYKLGQVITINNISYTVIDYACPKKDQLFLKTSYSAVYSAAYDWLMEKAFILEPIEPPDPEATVYKPGQLIVRDSPFSKGLVYRVIAYRKANKGEYMTNSDAPLAIICDTAESSIARWVVEPYCVS